MTVMDDAGSAVGNKRNANGQTKAGVHIPQHLPSFRARHRYLCAKTNETVTGQTEYGWLKRTKMQRS